MDTTDDPLDAFVAKLAEERDRFISDALIELAMHGRVDIDVATGRVIVSKEVADLMADDR